MVILTILDMADTSHMHQQPFLGPLTSRVVLALVVVALLRMLPERWSWILFLSAFLYHSALKAFTPYPRTEAVFGTARLDSADRRRPGREVLSMAHLCSLAYGRFSIVRQTPRLDGWELVEQADGGILSLFKRISSGSHQPTWAVAIRGTAYWRDVRRDINLFWDSVRPTVTSAFSRDAGEVVEAVRLLLDRHGIQGNITFTGHSLGASYAEVAFFLLNRAYGSSCNAVTFDSPGQPQSYRRAINMPAALPGVFTLLATPNMVNTLNTPIAASANLWSCNVGANISLVTVYEMTTVILNCLPSFPLRGVLSLWEQNTMKHQIKAIIDSIEVGDIHQTSATTWPRYSARIARWMFSDRPRTAELTPTPQRPERVASGNGDARIGSRTPRPMITSTAVDSNIPDLPADPNDMEEKQPYLIRDPYGELERFKEMLVRTGTAVAFAFCGLTNAGKTSSLKAILGLPFEDERLRIRYNVNNTPHVIVTWSHSLDLQSGGSACKVYLLDIPGAGAAAQLGDEEVFNGDGGSHARPWVVDSATTIIERLADFVGCIFYVEKEGAPQTTSVEFYEALKKCADDRQLRMRVLFNCHTNIDAHMVQGRINMARVFGIPETAIVAYRAVTEAGLMAAARAEAKHDVGPLLEMWNRETSAAAVSARPLEFSSYRARLVQTMRAHELEMRSLPPDRWDGFTGLALSVVAWVPGAAMWQVACGTGPLVLSVASVSVFAVPTAAVATLTGTVWATRRFRITRQSGWPSVGRKEKK